MGSRRRKSVEIRAKRPRLVRLDAGARPDVVAGVPAPAAEPLTAAKPAVTTQVKRILVFMATSTPRLIDTARAAIVTLREGLSKVYQRNKDAVDSGAQRVEVYVRVHGHQVEGDVEQDSTEFKLLLSRQWQPASPVRWSRPVPSEVVDLAYIPGDVSAIGQWVRKRMEDAQGLDSTMLVVWGHGEGVGSRLNVPLDEGVGVRGSGPDAVARPGLLNVAGLPDRPLAAALADAITSADARPLDLLVFDSCLMAGAELAFEFRKVAEFIVASQAFVGTGPGAPGLNLGAVVQAFAQNRTCPASQRVSAKKRDQERRRRVRAAGRDILDLIGETRSGAQQLTLFQLQADAASDLAGRIPDLLRTLKDVVDNPRPDEVIRGCASFEELFWLFARLLCQGSANPAERQRILIAFQEASYGPARQFLDLQDLARQVQQVSRFPALQHVAHALTEVLKPQEDDDQDSLIVDRRAGLRLEEKQRVSGVTVYCPWFEADPDSDPPAFDVLVDHDSYRALELPLLTGWADFVLGPLYDATAGERQRQRQAARVTERQHELCFRLVARMLGQERRRSMGGRAEYGVLSEPKPSGATLGRDE